MKGQFTHCPKANCKFNFVYNWAFGAGQLYNGARRDQHSTFGVKPPVSSGFQWSPAWLFRRPSQHPLPNGRELQEVDLFRGNTQMSACYQSCSDTAQTYLAVMLRERGDAQRTPERYHHLGAEHPPTAVSAAALQVTAELFPLPLGEGLT